MKQKLLFLLTALCFGFISGVKADEPAGSYVYFNDFETFSDKTATGSVTGGSKTDATIQGNGSFSSEGGVYGTVFQNVRGENARSNYLLLPDDAMSHSADSKALTIGFWVNKKSGTDFYWSPIFTAYGSAPNPDNGTPMFWTGACKAVQYNVGDGNWCDFTGAQSETSAWLDDGKWHYYTVTFNGGNVKVYIDGVVANSWTLDDTTDGQKISTFYTNTTAYSYICLGGNQRWNFTTNQDKDPAFAYDDLYITNAALTSEQILQIMSNKLQAEIVGALDYSTPYWRVWNKTPIWINVGETGYYKFVNHNKGGNPYENWYLYAANESSENLTVLRADNHVNIGGGTINSFPETSDITADLADATVELYVSLADAGDGTNTLTSTAIITKADHSVMSPNYVYTQTGINVSKLKLYVSVEKCWLELFEQQGYPTTVSKTITAAKWATYCSPYALDFSSSIENLDAAYIVTGGENKVLALTEVTGTVPANTGLLLKGEGECAIPVVASSSTSVDANKLVGVTAATEIAAEAGYVLMGSPKIGFYKNANKFTVGANTAYLPIDFDENNPDARSAFFGFDENVTGINAIGATETEAGALKDGKYLIGNKIVLVKNGMKYDANGKKLN